jgi:hypothetical protein
MCGIDVLNFSLYNGGILSVSGGPVVEMQGDEMTR